jgi:hypothetical protein
MQPLLGLVGMRVGFVRLGHFSSQAASQIDHQPARVVGRPLSDNVRRNQLGFRIQGGKQVHVAIVAPLGFFLDS